MYVRAAATSSSSRSYMLANLGLVAVLLARLMLLSFMLSA